MAGFLSVYGANSILDGTVMPPTMYAQGHLSNPGNTGTLGVAAETRRLPMLLDPPVAGVAVNANTASIASAAADEVWNYLTLWDASSGGNCWWIVPLSVGLSVVILSTIRLEAGFLSLSFPRWGE